MKKIETVARAICYAASSEYTKDCSVCLDNNGKCAMWKSFKNEARAAVKATEKYNKENGLSLRDID